MSLGIGVVGGTGRDSKWCWEPLPILVVVVVVVVVVVIIRIVLVVDQPLTAWNIETSLPPPPFLLFLPPPPFLGFNGSPPGDGSR